jgi:organic hydroperoxide reductase OsmC/OhrA
MTLGDSYTYELGVEWSGQRAGRAWCEGFPAIEFSAPPEFGGQAGQWTPEHLLLAAAASCFQSTFLAIAEISKLTVLSFTLKGQAVLEKVPGEGYKFTRLRLEPRIGIPAGDEERARKILGKAQKGCFVTKSLTCEVTVEPSFAIAEAEVAR